MLEHDELHRKAACSRSTHSAGLTAHATQNSRASVRPATTAGTPRPCSRTLPTFQLVGWDVGIRCVVLPRHPQATSRQHRGRRYRPTPAAAASHGQWVGHLQQACAGADVAHQCVQEHVSIGGARAGGGGETGRGAQHRRLATLAAEGHAPVAVPGQGDDEHGTASAALHCLGCSLPLALATGRSLHLALLHATLQAAPLAGCTTAAQAGPIHRPMQLTLSKRPCPPGGPAEAGRPPHRAPPAARCRWPPAPVPCGTRVGRWRGARHVQYNLFATFPARSDPPQSAAHLGHKLAHGVVGGKGVAGQAHGEVTGELGGGGGVQLIHAAQVQAQAKVAPAWGREAVRGGEGE